MIYNPSKYWDEGLNPIVNSKCKCEVPKCWAMDMIHTKKSLKGWQDGWYPERLSKPSLTGKAKVYAVQWLGDIGHKKYAYRYAEKIFSRLFDINYNRRNHKNDYGHHTFLMLTKYPEILSKVLLWDDGSLKIPGLAHSSIFIGTTLTGKNKSVDVNRAWELFKFKKAGFKIWASIEPLMAEVSIGHETKLWDQVIVGCDTSPGAPEPNLDWFRSIRDQCLSAGVPLFVKKVTKKTRILDNVEYNDLVWRK